MNGLWVLLLLDLQAGVEIRGGPGWFAARPVACSPLFGFELRGDWVAFPVDAK